jgi:hypothetical protein
MQAQCAARLTELFTVRELGLARESRLLIATTTADADAGATDATAVLLQPGQWLPQSEQVRSSLKTSFISLCTAVINCRNAII